MKKICLLALLAFVGMAACTDDQVPVDGGTGTIDGKYRINVTLRLPGTDVVSYAGPNDYQIAAQDKEIKVDTIAVYMFYQQTTGSGPFILQAVFNQGPDFRPVNQADGTNITLQVEGEGVKHLYFVANDSIGIASLASIVLDETKEEDFKRLLTDKTSLSTPMLMTAYTEADPSTAVGGSVTVSGLKLDRVGARIDVENWEQTLAIDSVQLLNTPDQSYIVLDTIRGEDGNKVWRFADASKGVTRIDREVVPIPDGARVAPRTAGSAYAYNDSVYLPSLYYPYETDCGANNQDPKMSKLKIWGRLNAGNDLTKGVRVVYEIPLNITTAGSDDATQRRMLRNHRYVVRINNALSASVDYTFTLKDWQYQAGDTIKRPITAGNIKLDWGEVDGNGWDAGTRALAVDSLFPNNKADTVYTVKVKAETDWKVDFVSASASAGAGDWITITKTPVEAGDVGTEFKLAIKANTADKAPAREAMIRVESLADGGKFSTFTVKQRSNIPASN